MSNQRGRLQDEPHANALHFATVGTMHFIERALLEAVPERNQRSIDGIKSMLSPTASTR